MSRLQRIIPMAAGFHALLWSAVAGFAQAQRPTGPMHSPRDGVFWHWGLMILHVLFWIMVVVVLFLVIRWLFQNKGNSREKDELGRSPDRSLEVLKERYARGEIDREEFERKKRDLLS